MHIVISVLGAIVTILYILDYLGIDIGGMNPWSWRRRRAWARRYRGDPIYAIEDPMEVAALLAIGTARLEGELTNEQKQTALAQFADEFSMEPNEASALYASSTHLLASGHGVDVQLEGLLERHRDRFSPEQAESMIGIAASITSAGGPPSDRQADFLAALRSRYLCEEARQGTWS